MPSVTPSPRTWTLRFKNHRTTILLEVDPLQKFDGVRAELLHALQETSPSGKLNGHDIPKNPHHIKLGRAIDRHKLTLGFVSINSDAEEASADASGKGKGKSAAGTPASLGKGKAALGAIIDCPQGAGFKNGDVVAFKFASEHHPTADGGDIIEQWHVEVPTLEDTYGEDEAQYDGADVDDQ